MGDIFEIYPIFGMLSTKYQEKTEEIPLQQRIVPIQKIGKNSENLPIREGKACTKSLKPARPALFQGIFRKFQKKTSNDSCKFSDYVI